MFSLYMLPMSINLVGALLLLEFATNMFVLTEPFSQLIIAWFSIYYEICNFHAALEATEQSRIISYYFVAVCESWCSSCCRRFRLQSAGQPYTPHGQGNWYVPLSFALPPLHFNLLFDCLSCIDLLTLELAANRKQMYSEWERREMDRVYIHVCQCVCVCATKGLLQRVDFGS